MDVQKTWRILTLFQILARYLCISNETLASKARETLRKETRGTDNFFVALLQDLNQICAFLSSCQGSEASLSVRQHEELASLTKVLASALLSRDGGYDRSLIEVYESTIDWNLDCVQPYQLQWLLSRTALVSADARLRKDIISASGNTARTCRSGNDYNEDDTHGASDAWALAAVVHICEPLAKIHTSILEQWACACPDPESHSDLLVSFALPCHQQNRGSYALHFGSRAPEHAPWRVTSLLIDDQQAEEASSSDFDIHDTLSGMAEQAAVDGVLTFETLTQVWSQQMLVESQQYGERPVMIDLKRWIASDRPCPVSKVKFVDRVALAIILCYTFLELGGSPWLPYDRHDLNIWLASNGTSIPCVVRPFVGAALDPELEHNEDDGTGFFLTLANGFMPNLLVLGKLIFELIVGRAVPWAKLEAAMLEFEDQNPERLVCLEAVRSCIGLRDTTFKAAEIRGDERLRSEFLARVVYKLNYVLVHGCRTSLEHVISESTASPAARSKTRSPRRTAASPSLESNSGLAYCLHDDSTTEPFEQRLANKANSYLGQLDDIHAYLEDCGDVTKPVKIAVIDTGARLSMDARQRYGSRLQEIRSWTHDHSPATGLVMPEGSDEDGHGTQSALACLKASPPRSLLWIAQVFQKRGETQKGVDASEQAAMIRDAIIHAVREWRVDVISMSFGFAAEVDVIESALKEADQAGILLLAAASNIGGNTSFARRWPAKRDNVMCMYACEGEGNWYDRNPSPDGHDHNFATLGVSVPLSSLPHAAGQASTIYRSGTSISTPIAAGIAACVLEAVERMQSAYLEHKLDLFNKKARAHGWVKEILLAKKRKAVEDRTAARYEQALRKLKTARGMRAVFAIMAEPRNGYQYVQPWKLLREHEVPITLVTKVFEALEEAHLLPRAT